MASQFLWRRVQAKLLARDREYQRSDALTSEALDLIGSSDSLDWQGNGFMDLAEVCRLGGRIADAVEALGQAPRRFAEARSYPARFHDCLGADCAVIISLT